MAKHKNKFSDKRYSVGGFISLFMAVSAIVLLAMAIIMSFKARGKAGTVVGTYALTALLVSVFGCIVGLLSYRETNRIYTFSFAGALLSGIMAVIMVFLLMVGI